MSKSTKIATCCYCGTRAALILKGSTRHELACSACGAPLHALKSLRSDAVDPAMHRAPRKGKRKADRDARAMGVSAWQQGLNKPKKRKRKSPARRLLSEAFDLIEDIFD
jgi:hypothetical protein